MGVVFVNKLDYNNAIRQHVFSLKELVDVQVGNCFGKGLSTLLSDGEIRRIQRIFLTGCGDSYAASLAFVPMIKRSCGISDVRGLRAIDFTRYTPKEEFGDAGTTLVIAISTGGGTARVAEALEKSNSDGALSVLITNNGESRCAGLANKTMVLGTPDFEPQYPGLRSYFGSLTGILAVVCRVGIGNGTLPADTEDKWIAAIKQYVSDFSASLEKIDDQLFSVAQSMNGCTSFDFVGDGVEHATAFFGAAKFLECPGIFCSWDDSEDWCHVNYFLKDPDKLGTVIMADRHSPSFGRIQETVASAKRVGRPVLVVTNAGADAFIEGVDVCTVPETPNGFEWLKPLMDYNPASILAGYMAALRAEPYFRATYLADGQPDMNNPWKRSMTIRTSKIELH